MIEMFGRNDARDTRYAQQSPPLSYTFPFLLLPFPSFVMRWLPQLPSEKRVAPHTLGTAIVQTLRKPSAANFIYHLGGVVHLNNRDHGK